MSNKHNNGRSAPSQHPLTEKGRRARNLLSAAILAGGLAVIYTENSSTAKNAKVKALETATQIQNNRVVLDPGAVYRSSPISASDANNIEGKVPAGQEWVATQPLSTTAPDIYTVYESGWIAFTPPGTNTKSIKSLQDRADKTVYADFNALEEQGLAQVYSYPPQRTGIAAESEGQLMLNANLGSDGSIYIAGVPNPNTNPESGIVVDPVAATSYSETAGTYAAQAQAGTAPN
jgi:hypothetical protein